MVRSRRLAGRFSLCKLARRLAVPAAMAAAVGVVSLPAGAAVTDHNPIGRAGAPAGPPPAHRAAMAGQAKAPVSGLAQPLTRNSRTVRHANGSYTTTIFPGPVNYRTAV